MSGIGIVVIGRNEGARLERCLASLGTAHRMVYVDSGSSDGSVAAARAAGAVVIELDMALPFTAARARNAGRRALPRDCAYAQFVDGDCTLAPEWLATASAALDTDAALAVVFGRLREVAPDASRYNWLCDVEWSGPPGRTASFGGNAMLRLAAFDAAGGYAEDMIAGEEPDLAIRLGARGFAIERLDAAMGQHDAAMHRFGQWWRRMRRAGHADADLAARHHGQSGLGHTARIRSALLWGLAVPAAAIVVAITGAASGQRALLVAAGLLLAAPLAQAARIALREAARRPLGDALTIATFLMLAKPAQAIGILRERRARQRGVATKLIEYKGA